MADSEEINKNPYITDEEIIIPEGVVNEEDYREWKKGFNRWNYSDESKMVVEVERTGQPVDKVELDFTCPTFLFNKYLNRIFDEKLKEKILEKKKEWDSLRGKLAMLKQQAFGTRKSGPTLAVRDSILDVKKTEILELFGKFYNLTEVHRIVITEYKLECNIQSLDGFRIKHLDQIKELQEEYVKDYSDIRLTHKKSRLEELNELYVGRKNIYNTSKKAEDYKLLLQTIEQIKREVEGDIVTINGNINLNIEQTLVSHIYQELIRGLAIKEIILSRVAARTNSNPYYLISRLSHSFYAKFNGFDVNDEIDLAEQINLYPSQVIYNFDEIRNLSESRKLEKNNLSKLGNIGEEKHIEIQNVKEDLLNRIKNNMIHIEQEKERMDKFKKNKQIKEEKAEFIEYEDLDESSSE